MSEREARRGEAGDGVAPEAAGKGVSRRVVVDSAAAGCALVAARVFDGLPRWIAVAVLATVVPDLVRALPVATRRRLAAAAPALLVVAAGTVLLWDLVLGRPPVSRDHAIHYFQTSILVDELLPSGRLWGWTDRLNDGYPFGESYPVLGHLWVAAGHLLSFGVLDLRTSYAWGLLGMWGLALVSVWWVATTIARELTSTSDSKVAWAGCIGALLWLFDPGGSREGGWSYVMFHGVWPQMLSSTLWTLSLVLTWKALRAATVRRLALAGACLGASVLAHPFGLLTAAASAAGWIVVLLVLPDGRAVASGRFRLWLLVHALAGAVAAGWVMVFFGSAESMGRSPVFWAPLGELATKLVAGDLFEAQSAWAGVLTLLGMVAVARRGKAISWLVLGLTLGMIVLGSHSVLTVLRADLIVGGFENLQFPRYAIAIKPLAFALGGVGALVVLRGFGRWTDERSTGARPRALRFVGALLFAPLLAAGVHDGGRLFARPVAGIESLAGTPHAEYEAGLLAALRTERERTGSPPRVAFLRMHMGGGMYPIFSIADAGADLVLDGHVATINFEHRFGPRKPGALAALGVTHVVFDRELGEDEAALAEALEDRQAFGPYTLARFRRDGIERHMVTSARPTVQLETIEASPERLVVDVGGVARRTRLTILRAPHTRWRATLDGTPLDILEGRAHGGLPVMMVRVPQSGRLELRYQWSGRERVAAHISLLAIGLVLLALLSTRRIELADRLHAPAAQRLSALMLGMSVALVLMWVSSRKATRLEQTWTDAIARSSARRADHDAVFVRDLIIDGAFTTARTPQQICVGLTGRDALPGCSEAAHRPSVAILYAAPHLYRCLAVTVPPNGLADVHLEATGDVLGMVVRMTHGRGQHLTWRPLGGQDGQRRTVSTQPSEFHLRADAFPAGFTLRLGNRSSAPERVCVAAAEVRAKASGATGAALD